MGVQFSMVWGHANTGQGRIERAGGCACGLTRGKNGLDLVLGTRSSQEGGGYLRRADLASGAFPPHLYCTTDAGGSQVRSLAVATPSDTGDGNDCTEQHTDTRQGHDRFDFLYPAQVNDSREKEQHGSQSP